MSKPFLTPDDAIDAEIASMTSSINAALASGVRKFNVPSRVADSLRKKLEESGWLLNTDPSDEPDVLVLTLRRPH